MKRLLFLFTLGLALPACFSSSPPRINAAREHCYLMAAEVYHLSADLCADSTTVADGEACVEALRPSIKANQEACK